MPIDHVKLPVSDLEASRAFYLAALAPFGYVLVYDGESSLGFGRGDGGEDDEPFAVERTNEPTGATHVSFTASSPEQVNAFHAAAVAAAFVRDPDGHNVEAVYHGPALRRESSPAD